MSELNYENKLKSLSPKARKVFELLNSKENTVPFNELINIVETIDNTYRTGIIPEFNKTVTPFLEDVLPVMDGIALECKTNGKFLKIERSVESETEYNYYIYDNNYNLLEEDSVSLDDNEDGYDIREAAKNLIAFNFQDFDYSDFNHIGIVQLENAVKEAQVKTLNNKLNVTSFSLENIKLNNFRVEDGFNRADGFEPTPENIEYFKTDDKRFAMPVITQDKTDSSLYNVHVEKRLIENPSDYNKTFLDMENLLTNDKRFELFLYNDAYNVIGQQFEDFLNKNKSFEIPIDVKNRDELIKLIKKMPSVDPEHSAVYEKYARIIESDDALHYTDNKKINDFSFNYIISNEIALSALEFIKRGNETLIDSINKFSLYRPITPENYKEQIKEHLEEFKSENGLRVNGFNIDSVDNISLNLLKRTNETNLNNYILTSIYAAKDEYEFEKDKETLIKKYGKTPFVMRVWSENNNVNKKEYSLKDFNELIAKEDYSIFGGKKYLEKKYNRDYNDIDFNHRDENGNYKYPQEDRAIARELGGYDKTDFSIIYFDENKNEYCTYTPHRYDIGDGNGSVFDFIRTTCSYPEITNIFNDIENKLYYNALSGDELKAKNIKSIITSAFDKDFLKEEIKNLYEHFDLFEIISKKEKDLRKNVIIMADEANILDKQKDSALSNITDAYNSIFEKSFTKISSEINFSEIQEENKLFIQNFIAKECRTLFEDLLYEDNRNKTIYENGNIDWDIWREERLILPSVALFDNSYILQKVSEINFADNSVQENFSKLKLENQILDIKKPVVSPEALQKIIESDNLEYEKSKKLREEYGIIKNSQGWKGINSDKGLKITEVAKLLRTYIKENYPGYKFSINCSQYDTISINLKEYPVELTNNDLMNTFIENNIGHNWKADFEKDGKPILFAQLSQEEKDTVIKEKIESARNWSVNLGISNNNDESWLNPEILKVLKDIKRFCNSYSYNYSDSYTDYYNSGFTSEISIENGIYIQKNISKENKSPVSPSNKSAGSVQIVINEKYNIPNLKFDGKPKDEIRIKMKNEGWTWNSNSGVWWPRTKEAQNNANVFAEKIVNSFTKEKKHSTFIGNYTVFKSELIKQKNNFPDKDIVEIVNEMKDSLTKDGSTYVNTGIGNALSKLKKDSPDMFSGCKSKNDELRVVLTSIYSEGLKNSKDLNIDKSNGMEK